MKRYLQMWGFYYLGDFVSRLMNYVPDSFEHTGSALYRLYNNLMTASDLAQGDGNDGPWGFESISHRSRFAPQEDERIEKVARAWASIDGKLDQFEACKKDPIRDRTQGYYRGYREDARELLKRSGI
jgi:hypothetical protein